MKLDKKIALVTGGGSGIGLAISNALSAKGATVIICGRNKAKLENAKQEFPSLEIEVCDVSNSDQITALASSIEHKFGGLDLLVNNAGICENVDYVNGSPTLEMQEREIDIDFVGPIRMIHHFLPILRKRNESAIVNVSSGLAFVPLTLAPVYCATKAGLHSWTRSFRYQMAKTNVKVFELMPPLVETDMVADFEGQKMMKPDVLAKALIKGLEGDKYEITPGQSSQLKMMSKLAPGFIFKMLNKQFG